MARLTCILIGLALLAAAGCGEDSAIYTTEARLNNGLVIILPGIEGESSMNHGIRQGLQNSGCNRALPIYSWGRPIPGVGMILNQVDFIGNRLAGVRIAKMIEEYQDQHPGKPVYLVGHSGGGGVAVFVAEGLSEGRQVDGLVLLSASIWSGYDLTKAMGRCRNGIVNFYNESDVGLLGVGTTVLSNVDGMKGPSAGLVGFTRSKASDPPEKRAAYSKLYQVPISAGMGSGDDPHAAVTRPRYVSAYVAPWISSSSWPAGRASSTAQLSRESKDAIAALEANRPKER